MNMINDCKEVILRSPYFSRLSEILRKATFQSDLADGALKWPLVSEAIQHLIVYGLGSLEQPGALHIRYQVALACLLPSLLPGLIGPPEAYDPVFTALDKAVLNACGMTVIPRNENGKRKALGYTLFFMPHCESELTENLLEANWGSCSPSTKFSSSHDDSNSCYSHDAARRDISSALFKIAILGNSFSTYLDRWNLQYDMKSKRQSALDASAIARVHRELCVLEQRIDDSDFPVNNAFNDLSLHVVYEKTPLIGT